MEKSLTQYPLPCIMVRDPISEVLKARSSPERSHSSYEEHLRGSRRAHSGTILILEVNQKKSESQWETDAPCTGNRGELIKKDKVSRTKGKRSTLEPATVGEPSLAT